VRIRLDETPRRIRARLGGNTVLDSHDAKLLYAEGRHPTYVVPVDDLHQPSLQVLPTTATDTETEHPLGPTRSILTTDGTAVGVVFDHQLLAGLAEVSFEAMDQWLEEDEEIYFKPRDPYRRVDVLESSRHVEIRVGGQVVARTDRPRMVAETGLPARWYLPRVDVNWEYLVGSSHRSYCQYKGEAEWWHVQLPGGERIDDLVWGYERPAPEAPKLAGLVAFYGEHKSVETIVDGAAQPRPSFEPSWLNPGLTIGAVDIQPGH
jgi:uncharacterized protein (DUF427 family)